MTPSSGAVRTRNSAPPGFRARIEKASGFLVVVVLVDGAESCTTVELVLETILVPAGKYVATMTLPTSLEVKFAVRDVNVAESIVVAPSAKVTPPMNHGGR